MYGNRWDIEELKGLSLDCGWSCYFEGHTRSSVEPKAFSMFVFDHCSSSMKYFCLFIEIQLKVHHYIEMVIMSGNGHETER